jgi:hypothetical protein
MNKILLPKVTFKEGISDEKRIEIAYARIFEMARRNILAKRQLTNGMSTKYNKIQYGKRVFNDRGGSSKNAG